MRTEITLYLKPDPERNAPAREIADQLMALGGWMTGWEANPSCLLGCATFAFADERDCNRFLKAALRVPGVYRERHELQPLPRTSSSTLEASDARSPMARH